MAAAGPLGWGRKQSISQDNRQRLCPTDPGTTAETPDQHTFSASSIDLLVTGGPSGKGYSSVSVRNLHIRTRIERIDDLCLHSLFKTVNVTGNATIDAGGAISVDGNGSGASFRNRRGRPPIPAASRRRRSRRLWGGQSFRICGAYDSIQSPSLRAAVAAMASGSSTAPYGGAGRRGAPLNVTRHMAVNGRVSANGKNGDINSGWRSGGSLWITAGTIAGSGTISATAAPATGSAVVVAGGRISLGYTTSAFNGLVRLVAAADMRAGGAGTITPRPTASPWVNCW